MGLGAIYRTARYTQWSQLLWRARYALERRQALMPKVAARWAWKESHQPHLRIDFPDMPFIHSPHGDDAKTLTLLSQGVFRHLNETRRIGYEVPDWRLGPVLTDRLWTVTLHYHAWACCLAELATTKAWQTDVPAGLALNEAASVAPHECISSHKAATLLEHYLSDWIRRCALDMPGTRHLAWNAYAIATRIGWWIRSYRLLSESSYRLQGRVGHEFLRSLWQQACYLHEHLEWDLRGNHLLRDAVGLAWAGRFFAEEQSQRWLATATRLAWDQAAEQVLPDGGHFERSPMYHVHIMEDILSLALLIEEPSVRARLCATWQRMAEYIAWLRHPDKKLAHFNDGGLDASCESDTMLRLGRRLGVTVDVSPRHGGRSFPDTGMVVWHAPHWSVFFDVGLVGPDYQPGHAHADTLAIECSYCGNRLFVDTGCYAYDHDERRRYDRSTQAHNTVCIDQTDSSEVWHIFRVGRRAKPIDVEVQHSASCLRASASHTGYEHLPGQPRHHRELRVDAHDLVIVDRIEGGGNHAVEGGFTLAPCWNVQPVAGGWELEGDGRRLRCHVRAMQELRLSVEPVLYHPNFGVEVKTLRIVWRYEGDLPLTVMCKTEPS